MQQGLRALQIAERAGVTVCYGTDLLVSMHALQTEEVSQHPSFLAGIATHRPSQFAVRASVLSAATILKQATTNPGESDLVLGNFTFSHLEFQPNSSGARASLGLLHRALSPTSSFSTPTPWMTFACSTVQRRIYSR